MSERLQKVLAAAGVASRRDAETLITSGKVTVNGKPVRELGYKVDPERDNVAVEGRTIPQNVEKVYLALYKPAGYVTTREDPHAENIVMDLVRPAMEAKLGRKNPAVEGIHPVGRLDTQTEGLLILTNDGAFTQALTHPKHGVPKLYLAETRGVPDDEAIEKLRTGVPLFGQRTLPARVRIRRVDRNRGTASLEIELREGRNQQIRRMLQAVGFPVTKLKRISIGPVGLERLKPKQWRFLTEAEVTTLLEASRKGVEAAEAEPEAPRPRRPRIGYAGTGGPRSGPRPGHGTPPQAGPGRAGQGAPRPGGAGARGGGGRPGGASSPGGGGARGTGPGGRGRPAGPPRPEGRSDARRPPRDTDFRKDSPRPRTSPRPGGGRDKKK